MRHCFVTFPPDLGPLLRKDSEEVHSPNLNRIAHFSISALVCGLHLRLYREAFMSNPRFNGLSPVQVLSSLDPYTFLHPLGHPDPSFDRRALSGSLIYVLGDSGSLKTSLLFQLAANAGLADLLVSFVTTEAAINSAPPLFPTDSSSPFAFPEAALDRVHIQLLRGTPDVRSYMSTLHKLPPSLIPSAFYFDAADFLFSQSAASTLHGSAYAPRNLNPSLSTPPSAGAHIGAPAGLRSGLPPRLASTAEAAAAVAAVSSGCGFVTRSVLPSRAPAGSTCRAVVVGSIGARLGGAWAAVGAVGEAVFGRRAMECSSVGGAAAVAGGCSGPSAKVLRIATEAAAMAGGGRGWGAAEVSAGPVARTVGMADAVVLTMRLDEGALGTLSGGGGGGVNRSEEQAREGVNAGRGGAPAAKRSAGGGGEGTDGGDVGDDGERAGGGRPPKSPPGIVGTDVGGGGGEGEGVRSGGTAAASSGGSSRRGKRGVFVMWGGAGGGGMRRQRGAGVAGGGDASSWGAGGGGTSGGSPAGGAAGGGCGLELLPAGSIECMLVDYRGAVCAVANT